MKGNLRPPAPMPRDNSIMLPSARIRCDSGTIQVGNRSFLSASDALSAYMQQFDWKQPSSRGSSSSARNTSLDALIQKSALDGVSSTFRGKPDPVNVTGLLTGSPRSADINGASLNSMSSACSSRLLNGESHTLQSSKHSVSFALPDLPDSSQQHLRNSASFAVEDSARSPSSPRQHSAGAHRIHQHVSPSFYSTTQYTSSDLSGLSYLGATDTSLPHHASTSGSGIYGNSLSQSNGRVGNGLSKSSGILQNGGDAGYAQVKDARNDSHRVPKAEEQHAKSEVEVLLSAMPSQRELHTMSQDALSEVKLKRLLKETNTTQSSSNSSNKSSLQQEGE